MVVAMNGRPLVASGGLSNDFMGVDDVSAKASQLVDCLKQDSNNKGHFDLLIAPILLSEAEAAFNGGKVERKPPGTTPGSATGGRMCDGPLPQSAKRRRNRGQWKPVKLSRHVANL